MSGQHRTIWEDLGIDSTEDKKLIRHAYARKCRECHPEDHPEEFRQLHQSYEQAMAWADKKKEADPPAERAETEEGEEPLEIDHASEYWEELMGKEREGEEPSEIDCTSKYWEELLNRGMEENAASPVLPDPLSWQQFDRTRYTGAALTESEELLKQMKSLEAFSRDNPPLDDSAWQQMMESWDFLADSRLFRQIGTSSCYFQMLLGWMNAERGRLHIPTIVGILRIYQIKGRILGHPWKARRYEKRIPEIPRLTYEFVFYQSLWTEAFLEKFNRYGDQKEGRKRKTEEEAAFRQMPERGLLQWMSEHRFLWKLFCVVLILLLRFLIRRGG